ncbi:histidine kinase dimerization/phospho-acceptor domain-containing protein [Kitasatospora saccharophila]|uniref:histidine kinase n=1 Tax=Kitasatospora saccharophila TaxID=407973 RepID=A0ABP5J7N5_9ACTN
MTLRRQIAAVIALVSCLVALAVGLLVHQASVRQHTDQARKSALTALDAVLTGYDGTGELVAGWHAAEGDPELPPELRQLALRGRQGSALGPGPAGPAMWAAAGTDGRVLSVRIDYAEDARAIAELDRAVAVGAALSVLVTVLAGVLAADRISSRLRTAARTARTIARGDLDARIGPLGRARDEVAELAAAVDSMSAALRSRLVGEQRFTADVAHELRTPLTGLLTASELLPPGRPTELVRDRVRALRDLTEDLLEVSRLDSGADAPELADLPLGPLLARLLAAGGTAVGGGGAELRVVADAVVSTDPRRLDRVLANLLANAQRHGRPPVVVTVEGSTVTVRDHGPGFPEEVLREGPRRFRTGARERGGGHGLGLTIAQGHARAIGAELRLSDHPDGGALARLVLPGPRADPGA